MLKDRFKFNIYILIYFKHKIFSYQIVNTTNLLRNLSTGAYSHCY